MYTFVLEYVMWGFLNRHHSIPNLANDMCSKGLPTLNAARRKKTGPGGQPPGTVAACPQEVDCIIRNALGPIYNGNTKVPHELTENT